MFASTVFAMGAPQGAAPADGGGILIQFMPLILMFAVFWFLLIRPQQKRAKAHREMLSNLKRGDRIITQGGFIGRILEINDEELLLECGEAKLKLSRGAVGGLIQEQGSKAEKSEKTTKGTDNKEGK